MLLMNTVRTISAG